jgi:phospholipase/carboxylesterase
MNLKTEKIGGLDCTIVDALPAGKAPTQIVVLCHGFGAPATDLVPLGPELLHLNRNLAGKVRFIFPAAPLSLDSLGMPGSRAWWPLDVEKVTRAYMTGEYRELRNEMPPGLPEARQLLTKLIDEVAQQAEVPQSAFVLGGFSQGAMIMTDVALRLTTAPSALCVLSGTMLMEDEWSDLASKRGPMRVLQSHGKQDPILPFAAAEWLRELFVAAGFDVDFIPFQGPHTIPASAMERMADMLEEIADRDLTSANSVAD